MREFKFRGWNGVKIIEDAVIVDGKAYKRGYIGNIYSDEASAGIPMQYTGLKDRNGVEIYEWDIIRFVQGINNSIEGEFIVKYSVSIGSFLGYRGSDQVVNLNNANVAIIVIGNIFEKPGLLDREEW